MSGSEIVSTELLFLSFQLILCVLVGFAVKKLHLSFLPESGAAMILGMLFGFPALLLSGGDRQHHFKFSGDVFFFGLLPPIVYQAGYTLKKRDFFRNATTILGFAVVGTLISTAVFAGGVFYLSRANLVTHLSKESPALEALVYGCLINAIDPVGTLSIMGDVHADPMLYNLVFGESVLNDAVAIVLFKTLGSFYSSPFTAHSMGAAFVTFVGISIGSIAVGLTASLACALVLKLIEIKAEYSKFELAIILLFAYISYLGAEVLELSGIFSVFFCGIAQAHYGYYNISHAAKIASKYGFEVLAYIMETFLYSYLGLQVVISNHQYDTWLIVSAIPLCILSRALNILPLSALSNLVREKPLSWAMQLMMVWSGLRGAIAYALVLNMPVRNQALETATLFVIVFTTLVFGGATAPLLRSLDLVEESPEIARTLKRANSQIPLLGGIQRTLSFKQDHTLHPLSSRARCPTPVELFKRLDRAYFKPFFGGQKEPGDEQLWMGASEAGEETSLFDQYQGPGFQLDLPCSWRFLAPGYNAIGTILCCATEKEDAHGPLADVTVTLAPSEHTEIEDYGEPMKFLNTVWPQVLRTGLRPLPRAGLIPSLSVGDLGKSVDQGRSQSSGERAQQPYVMSVDVSRDQTGRGYYKFEIVLSSGSNVHNTSSQRVCLACTVLHNILYLCRVQAAESWWLAESGSGTAKTIWSSFQVRDRFLRESQP